MSDVNVRNEIMAALTASDDPKDRAMLALLGRVLDRMEHLLTDVLNAEKVRLLALNGEAPLHKEDHEMTSELRDLNAVRAVKWVNSRLEHNGMCEYANKQIAEEQQDKQTLKARWDKMVEGLISELPKIVVYAALTLAGYGYLVAK